MSGIAPLGRGAFLTIEVMTGVDPAPKQGYEIVTLLNFFDELLRKVPAGK
jgi:hypothetical protein